MSDLTVILVQNKIPTPQEDYYFPDKVLQSIMRFGVTPMTLGRDEHWGGHGHKAKYLLRALNADRIKTKYLIFSDAFDALFSVHPDEILDTFLTFNVPIVFGAEKYCFSDASLAPALELKWPSNTSYKFLNSGWCIGETEAFHTALKEMDPENQILDDYLKEDQTWHHDNDQVHWQRQQLNGSIPIGLDTEAKMVWNMAGCEAADVDLTGEKVRCVETGTFPQVMHCNGGSKERWKNALFAKLGL